MLGNELPEATQGDVEAVIGAIAGVTEVGGALDRAAAAIAMRIGWPIAHAYLAADGGEPVARRDWYLTDPRRFGPFREVLTAERPVGGGMPARVMAARSPEWMVDMTKDVPFLRRRAATVARIVGGAGVPVVIDGRPAGVLEFFTDAPGAAEDGATRMRLVELAARVGAELGEERATREIAGRRRVVGAVVDGPVPFATLDGDLRLVDVNAALAQLIGRAASELEGASLTSLDAEPHAPLPARLARRLAAAGFTTVGAVLRTAAGDVRVRLHVWHAPGHGVAYATIVEPDVEGARIVDRVLRRAERRRRAVEVLRATPDDAALVGALAEATCGLLEAGGALAALSDPLGNAFATVGSAGLTPDETEHMAAQGRERRGLVGTLVVEDRPLRVADAGGYEGFALGPSDDGVRRSFLGVPLRAPDGAAIGHLIVVDRSDGRSFDELDEAAVLDLSTVAGSVVGHRRDERDARAARGQVRRLTTVNLSLLHQVRPDRMEKTAADLARSVTEADYAALVIVDPTTGAVTAFHHSGLAPAAAGRVGAQPAATGLLRALMVGTRPVRLGDLTTHPAHAGFPPHHPVMSTLLAAPIAVNGVSRGVLVCANRRHAPGFTAEDEAAATVIADGVAVALAAADDRGVDLLDRLAVSSQRLHEQEQAHWRFLGSMSHELRSSLSGIQMSADLLADPGFAATTGPQTQALAERMATTARHLIALVDNLLDLSRIQSRRLDVTMQALALDIVLRDVRATIEQTADAAQVLVDIPLGGRIPRVLADPVRLRQVLINLLTNAVKFTPSGGHVWLEVSHDEHDVAINVCDTGVGIPAEDIERIFLPFERGREVQAEGTGLGLSIARAIVELHGGRIEVTSWPGVGSRFTATFRLARAPHLGAEFEAAVEEDFVYAGGETNGRSALIVEDDPASEDSTSAVLRAAGYEVVTTQSCEGALREMERAVPDVVLLDVQLPDGNGLDIVPRLRELAGDRGVVILAFTADRIGDTEERAEQECDGFILKPLRPRELLSRVRGALPAR